MKGLLLKDFYTIAKQLKFVLILIIFLTIIPGFSAPSFIIVYSVMMSVTSLAYDERSKWNNMAVMMPYSKSDIVLSKYILGFISVIFASIITVTAQIIRNILTKSPFDFNNLIALFISICFATILQAVNLPFMFKLGVEKGRLVLLILIALFVMSGELLSEAFIEFLPLLSNDISRLFLPLLACAVIINIVSCLISISIYNHKLR